MKRFPSSLLTFSSKNQMLLTRKMMSRRKKPMRALMMRGLRPYVSVRGPANKMKMMPRALW